jgi:hypothetical protein
LDEELPTHPRRIIGADKRTLIAFWGIKGLIHVNWLPKDVRINAVYFRDEILRSISRKLQSNVPSGHKPCTIVHMDNTKVHTEKVVSSVMLDLKLKRTLQLPYRPDVCPSDFFLLVG